MTKRSDFQVNELDIASEWLRQSDLVKEYGDHQADAQQAYDSAKAALEVAKAKAAKEIRKEPAKFGIDKFSEKALENNLPLHVLVTSAQMDVINARHELDVARAAINALDHKRTAMSNVVEMIHLGLYSEPKERKTRSNSTPAGERGQSFRERGLRNRKRSQSD